MFDIFEYNKIRAKLIGHKFKHFKGNIYIVKDITLDTESEEIRVIYYDITKPDIKWDRPYSMFSPKVDVKKYPDVKQVYRFELLDEGDN